jgi:ligand-binding sensor domain-containing protein
MSRWKTRGYSLLWLGALVGVLYTLINPGEPPTPSGWTIWKNIGGIRAIAHASDGTYAGGLVGLFRLSEHGDSVLVPIPGVSSSPRINTMLVDRSGVLWVGHADGLSVREGQTWATYTEENGLPGDYAAGIIEAQDGSIWVAMHGGAARLPQGWRGQEEAVQQFLVDDGLPDNHLQAVAQDGDGGIWFGSYAVPNGGVGRFADGKWQVWLGTDGLPHPNVTSFLPIDDGQVWASFGYFQEGGAARFSLAENGWALDLTVSHKDLAGPKVRSLYKDDQGRLWLGHEYDGITVLKDNNLVRYLSMDHGLPAREVMTMHKGPDNALWMGTLDGVARLTPQAVEVLFAK